MSSSDGLVDWLKKQAKVNVNVNSYEKEFSNGYYLGQILYNFGLLEAFPDYFSNKPQPVYRNTHFELLVPAFSKLNIEFDENIQRALKKEDLGAAKKLLFKMKAEITKLQELPSSPLPKASSSSLTLPHFTLHERTKRLGLPPKTAKIEEALVRFESEFLQQKTQAKAAKDRDEQHHREELAKFREERRKNFTVAREYMRDWEKNMTGHWKITRDKIQSDKDQEIQWRVKNTGQIYKMEDARSVRFQEEFRRGIEDFEENANRLGVELEKDPTRTEKIEKAPFNLVAMMQKVSAKANLNEASRKQKESRERYLKLKQSRLAHEIQIQNNISSRIQQHLHISQTHVAEGLDSLLEEDFEGFVAAQRELLTIDAKAKTSQAMEKMVKGLKTQSDEEYANWCKQVRFKKQIAVFKERKAQYDFHYHICHEVFMRMFEMAEECLHHVENKEKAGDKSGQIDMAYWKELSRRFVNQEELRESTAEEVKLKSTILSLTKMKGMDGRDVKLAMEKYLNYQEHFAHDLTYGLIIPENRIMRIEHPESLSQTMMNIIDIVHPMKPVNMFPTENFNMVPLRISILGPSYAGKKTLAKRISSLFNIPVIDLNKLMERAKSLVRHEEKEEEISPDDQGKDKKVGAKKPPLPAGPKGGKDPKKPEAPVQLTETELELQKYGVKLKNWELLGQPIPDDIKMELILIELRTAVPEKRYAEVKAA